MSAAVMHAPGRDSRVSLALGRRRRVTDRVAQVLGWAATLVALAFLMSILITLFTLGARGLSAHVFTVVTKSPGSDGGLANAIIGSVAQAGLGTLIGTPIGLMVGTYLAEYAGRTRLGNAVRFVSDILLSAPSILIGLFIYQILVSPIGGFSGYAGSVALAIIVIPIVVRTDGRYAAADPDQLAGGFDCVGRTAMEDDRFHLLSGSDGWFVDGRAAGGGAGGRRDGATAVHVVGQFRVFRHDFADGELAGDDLSVCRVSLR